MKINGSVYVDENQLIAELEKLQSGKISEILLLRSVRQNSYMKLSLEDGYYDFCFAKESDFNTIKLPLSEYDNVVKALNCYCNKDGKYRKIFNWQKREQEKKDSPLKVEKELLDELDKSSTSKNINKRLTVQTVETSSNDLSIEAEKTSKLALVLLIIGIINFSSEFLFLIGYKIQGFHFYESSFLKLWNNGLCLLVPVIGCIVSIFYFKINSNKCKKIQWEYIGIVTSFVDVISFFIHKLFLINF